MNAAYESLLNECAAGRKKVQQDSRNISPGDIFIAISGNEINGADFIADAIARGASDIVCQEQFKNIIPDSFKGNIILHADPRQALGELAAARYGTGNLPLTIIGLTGTNGKTTSAFLLEHIFKSAGKRVGVIGTVNYRWPGNLIPAPLTTPDALTLHEIISKMNKSGVEVVIMEVSSHALVQNRVGGLSFAGALFTNLTQDHLDFHKNMEEYFRAKAKLFYEVPRDTKKMAINFDDEHGARLIKNFPHACSFGMSDKGEGHLKGAILSHTQKGMSLAMKYGNKEWVINTPLVGEFNAMNLLGVQALALQFGIDDFSSLESFTGVCGRLERVETPENFHIFVDYAHTPDALVKALKALRGAGFKKIITVFGCGGNRDKTKRPLMGEAVARHSDVAILTSDNPRYEDPNSIINDVLPGLSASPEVYVEADRKMATALGISLLDNNSALLIAGKGHEDYQIINGQKYHYSDQETVRELII